MSGPFGSQQWMYASGGFYPYELDNSLKFEDGDSSYLSRTPTSAGNQKVFTFSCWLKRGNLVDCNLLGAGTGADDRTDIAIADNAVFFQNEVSNDRDIKKTTAVLRDTSAWYHIVVAIDLTAASNADKVKMYVNNELQTSFVNNDTFANVNSYINGTSSAHYIGRNRAGSNLIDGYLAEVNFIDGLQLTPSSFGENKEGIWVPKDPTDLTYGTNGFRLPFTETTTANGFNTVTYTGNGATQSIEGVGFSPDLVWLKSRSAAYDHVMTDSVRGVSKELIPNKTDAETTQSGFDLISFDNDGFTLKIGTSTSYNNSSQTYVGWCWDAGTGSAASNTDGSITSTVKANQDYGFSIVNFVSTGSAGTVGHGLGVTPKLIIAKQRPVASAWGVYNETIGATKRLQLQATDAAATDSSWNNTAPTSTVFSQNLTGTSGRNIIAYCFADVTGHQKIGTYTGNGSSTGPTVTLGFKPAFLLIKRTDSTGEWILMDNTRHPSNPNDLALFARLNYAEASSSSYEVDFNSDGFQLKNTNSSFNASSGTYIYLAIADTRDAAFWTDASGNGNDWTPNDLQHSDVMPDTPTDGFATLNGVWHNSKAVQSEGNLQSTCATGATFSRSTHYMSQGAYYFEMYIKNGTTAGDMCLQYNFEDGGSYSQYCSDGKIYINGSLVGTYATFTTGDIIASAFDRDNNTVIFYKNGTQIYTSSSVNAGTAFVGNYVGSVGRSVIWNFGQDSSFNANEIAQGNADENGKGDFYYTPPSGYLALCNANLPDPAIDPNAGENPEDYFNTVLYTGNSTTNTQITGVGFQPDWVWIKQRNGSASHGLFDSVRGTEKRLKSQSTDAEATSSDSVTSFDSDGFTVGNNTGVNGSGDTLVAWNWLAGGTGVSNTDGSITSTVSANTDAGFSIVSYAGTGSATTVGHGLGVAPDLIIAKNRDQADGWRTYHNTESSEILLFLHSSSAQGSSSSFTANWTNTSPTSSVFSIGTDAGVNSSSENYICYCFSSKEGYSKFGSYTGNGSSNGPFVYTGFRPAFLMIKRTDATNDWPIQDNKRNDFNVVDKTLYADLSNAESDLDRMDFLSNGFKLRNTYAENNASGGTYIYMAFAEQPFKYSNAR